jgi:hypothetical protein
MTIITITSADVGTTVAQNGVMSRIIFVTSSREVFSNFTLVDDAPPFDVVPRQLFNTDLLCALTNSNGTQQFPAGCQLDTPVAFGNLTVAACPKGAVFTIDCTGALAQAVASATAFDRLIASTTHGEALRAAAQRRDDDAIIAAERLRTQPPPVAHVPPPPPPPPRPEWMNAADVSEAAAARAKATGPTIIGPSLEQIKLGLFIGGGQRAAEEAAGAAANAELDARVAAITAAREKAQAEATALLREQGHLK